MVRWVMCVLCVVGSIVASENALASGDGAGLGGSSFASGDGVGLGAPGMASGNGAALGAPGMAGNALLGEGGTDRAVQGIGSVDGANCASRHGQIGLPVIGWELFDVPPRRTE
jgi:hypothetical protein